MTDANNGNKPVTWDMLADKLDAEMQDIKTYTPPDTNSNLLSYFRVATAYIHRHLKEYGIPADMYEAINKREKPLGELANFWMDEAGRRDGDTRDKEDVAAISVSNWLDQVRQEEQAAAMNELRLDKRSLIYSEVTLDADGETISFLAGGMPDTYNIEDFEQYREFAAGLLADTAIFVSVESWSVGNGESETASEEEAALIDSNRDYLDKTLGIDHLQTAEFTEYVRDEDFEYGDDEPDEGMEP